MTFRLNSDYGEISLGPARLHWYNNPDTSDELEEGFTILSWGNRNIEIGQVDQDRPGIYLTRYVNGDVEHLRTIAQF